MEWRVTENGIFQLKHIHLGGTWINVAGVGEIKEAERKVRPFKRTITVAEGNPEFAVLQGLRGMIQNNIPEQNV